jgi:hypothetical protein
MIIYIKGRHNLALGCCCYFFDLVCLFISIMSYCLVAHFFCVVHLFFADLTCLAHYYFPSICIFCILMVFSILANKYIDANRVEKNQHYGYSFSSRQNSTMRQFIIYTFLT